MSTNNDFKFFNAILLTWLSLSWVLFLLTLFGLFYWWLITLIVIILFFLIYKYCRPPIPSKNFLLTSITIFIVTLIFSFATTPTIFSGRDQGSISQAAIRLAQNHQLQFSTSVSETFWQINSTPHTKFNKCLVQKINNTTSYLGGKLLQNLCYLTSQGKALNFPGFYYTPNGDLITQFPLVYISYLAFFFTFFGLNGLLVANATLLFVFTTAFYLLVKNVFLTNKKHHLNFTFLSIVLILSSFCFMWFAKFTLTENMASALLWVGILQATFLFTANSNIFSKKNILIAFLSFGLLVFTRLEGLAFFFMVFILFLSNKNTRYFLRKNLLRITLPSLLFLVIIFIINLTINFPFYKAILTASQSSFSDSPSLPTTETFNLFKVFLLYGLFFPILFGIIGIFKAIQKNKMLFLIPLIIASPALVYLFSPQITPDHPWMLRRFTFAVLPLFIFYSILLLHYLISRGYQKLTTIIISIILLANLFTTINYLFFIPNKNLIKQVSKLGKKFSNTDLILIDRLTTGNHWAMIADPLNFLFYKNAVYFFNPRDLTSISLKQYDNVYLIIPESQLDFYKNSSIAKRLVLPDFYKFETSEIYNLPLDKFLLPEIINQKTKGVIFKITK